MDAFSGELFAISEVLKMCPTARRVKVGAIEIDLEPAVPPMPTWEAPVVDEEEAAKIARHRDLHWST